MCTRASTWALGAALVVSVAVIALTAPSHPLTATLRPAPTRTPPHVAPALRGAPSALARGIPVRAGSAKAATISGPAPPRPAPTPGLGTPALVAAVAAALGALLALATRPPSGVAMGAGSSSVSRRTAGLAGAVAASSLLPAPAQAVQNSKTVGAVLPPYGDSGLYFFVPSKTETPAIRAGSIDPANPYSFAVPGTWVKQTVSNATSGNYCQPNCGEPWTEVIMTGPEGRVQVMAGPLDKLTAKRDAQLSDIGPPSQLILSLGPYITGTYIDEDSVLAQASRDIDGTAYYQYEVDADYGTLPPHGLAVAATRGKVLMLFIVSATAKQWAQSEAVLRAVQDSFRVTTGGRN